MKLTDKQIQYGFNYNFPEDRTRHITELSEYQGEDKLRINCTQLNHTVDLKFKSTKERKRVLAEWCDFLKNNPNSFTELSFGTRMPQELFDAVCHQTNLKSLDIKWGVYKDLSSIAQLQQLELLSIGSGAGVINIEPLSKLRSLVALSVENFQKIDDYSPLVQLAGLESLTIEGDGFGPQYIKVKSLGFLEQMPQLRSFTFLTARLQDKDYSPILKLTNVEKLWIRKEKASEELADELQSLPKLKWGPFTHNWFQ